MIHSDICDLKFSTTRGGNKYFIYFLSTIAQNIAMCICLRAKTTLEKFIIYKTEVENQLSGKIKLLRSAHGGEYVTPVGDYCAQLGIRHEVTPPYSPQSNGVVERKNRTLICYGLSQTMWGKAILSANYLLNKVPRKNEQKTPYEPWKGRQPSYKYLRMWGCLAKVAGPTTKNVKIGPKTINCIFIGYAQNSSTYRFLVYKFEILDIHKNTIMESRNVSFFEHIFPCKSDEGLSSSKPTYETMNEDSQDKNQEQEVEDEPRRSKRIRIKKIFWSIFPYLFARK